MVLLAANWALGQAQGLRFPEQPEPKDFLNIRVFEEVLVPMGMPEAHENRALARALEAYAASGKLDGLAPVEAFLASHPNSPWRISLLVNVGLMHRHVGRITRALDAWEEAWKLGKGLDSSLAKALAHRALGELLEANAGLGRKDRLETLLQETENRPLEGLVTEKVSMAREALTLMLSSPGHAYRCGPVALTYVKATQDPHAFIHPLMSTIEAGAEGTNLFQNLGWGKEMGLDLQMAQKEGPGEFPVPCVLLFRTGHFSAVLVKREGRYLIQDPFLGNTWVTQEVLEAESTGQGLVPGGALPSGWRQISAAQGERIWGKGAWGPGRPDDTRPDTPRVGGTGQPLEQGIPSYAFHANLAGLTLDTLVSSYTPLRGPRVELKVTYNQREYGQAQVFDYCNLGAKWTFNYLACLKDDSTHPDATVTLCHSGGGGQIFQSLGGGQYQVEGTTLARLVRTSPSAYTLTYPDGRQECYEMPDRAWGLRRIVLTRVRDRHGDELKLTWDPSLRLVAITDALGAATTLGYDLAADPLKLTRVTDPLGRTTRFHYNAQGKVETIESPNGVKSLLGFGPLPGGPRVAEDFLSRLETPASALSFAGGEEVSGGVHLRWLEARKPTGERQRLESAAGMAYAVPPEPNPKAPEVPEILSPLRFTFRESFFWDSLKPGQAKPAYPQAHHLMWGHGPGGFSSGILVSEKKASSPRRWFSHAGDLWGGAHPLARSASHPLTPEGESRINKGQLEPTFDGSLNLVTREYAPGSTLVVSREFDPLGRLIRETNSRGQGFHLTYDPKSGDLSTLTLLPKGGTHRFTFTPTHRLQTWVTPQGAKHGATYSAKGDLATWDQGARGRWSFAYDDKGRLSKATRGKQILRVEYGSQGEITALVGPGTQRLVGEGLKTQPHRDLPVQRALETLAAGTNGTLIRHILAANSSR